MPNTRLTFAEGTDVAAAVALAKQSDVAVVFATQWATESIDTTLVLPEGQDALITAVAAVNPRTVVVLETGGSVLMPWADQVSGIVMAWYPGSAGGKAIAEVLTGKVNPSGHLPMTLAASAEQLPHPKPPEAGDVSYFEGAAVGYKWFDKQALTPHFPFGHGLSYTTFTYGGLNAKLNGLGLDVSFNCQNTGERAGKGVPQVYVSGAGWEAPKRLGAFSKVSLEPGAQASVQVHVDPRLLAVWQTETRSWQIQAGNYEVLLGRSSSDIIERVSVSHPGGSMAASAPHAPPQ